jgi:hypothetical protein
MNIRKRFGLPPQPNPLKRFNTNKNIKIKKELKNVESNAKTQNNNTRVKS